MPRTRLQNTFTPVSVDDQVTKIMKRANRQLRIYMMDHDMQQKDLAKLAGISDASISKRFDLTHPWRLDELARISVECGFSLITLLDAKKENSCPVE